MLGPTRPSLFGCLLLLLVTPTSPFAPSHILSPLSHGNRHDVSLRVPNSFYKTSFSALLGSSDDYHFFDTTPLNVCGGLGGSGCVSFLREKGEPLKGPSGGTGGGGGSVYLECCETLNTLSGVRNRIHVKAEHGANGQGKSRDGKRGKDVTIYVPPGTIVREGGREAREKEGGGRVAGELKVHGDRMLVARGGRGGRGNKAFKTPKMKAPKLAEKGGMGVQRWLNLEVSEHVASFASFPRSAHSTAASYSSLNLNS